MKVSGLLIVFVWVGRIWENGYGLRLSFDSCFNKCGGFLLWFVTRVSSPVLI